jgi:hypothetical protein
MITIEIAKEIAATLGYAGWTTMNGPQEIAIYHTDENIDRGIAIDLETGACTELLEQAMPGRKGTVDLDDCTVGWDS